MKKIVLTVLLFAVSCGPATNTEVDNWEAQAANITIIRDTWGIPHVYGKTDADAVFGMVYAQAEDDFNLWSQCTLTVPFAPALADTYTINVVAWGQQAGPEAPRLRVSVDDNEPANGTSVGAFAITNKLIDLHQKLLGESLEPGDEELEASYQLLLETWQARSANPDNFWAWSWPRESLSGRMVTCFPRKYSENSVGHLPPPPGFVVAAKPSEASLLQSFSPSGIKTRSA